MRNLSDTSVLFISSVADLIENISGIKASQKIFLCDENTFKNCFFNEFKNLGFPVITISAGDYNKNFEQLYLILNELLKLEADRNSLLINLGGGMVCDIGGFAASIYKRGIRFVNIPTTTLAMADASFGGKTGVNIENVKNAAGTFYPAKHLYIYNGFLKTLPLREQVSGFAEVLKMLLLFDAKEWENYVRFQGLPKADSGTLAHYINIALYSKIDVVKQDPYEKNLRKSLNYGHSIGHAIEAVVNSETTDILHGEAILVGMQIENIISTSLGVLDKNECDSINSALAKIYPLADKLCDIEQLIASLKNDKKNKNGEILMTLLKEPENFILDAKVPLNLVEEILENLWEV